MRGPIRLVRFALWLAAGLTLPSGASASAGTCAAPGRGLVPRPGDRAITAETIASLRDVGRQDTGSDQGPAFGVSPDGTRVAIIVRRADPVHNEFCQTLVIVPRSARGRQLVLPLAGDPVRQSYDLRGLIMSSGLFSVNRPKWSPDGTTIAILASSGGYTQIMGISVKGGHRRVLIRPPGGVEDFTWSRDGKRLVYATRPGLAGYAKALDREALAGYHYDARVVPLASPRPLAPSYLAIAYRSVSLVTGRGRPASIAERTLLDPYPAPDRPADAINFIVGAGSRRAWMAETRPSHWSSPVRLWARERGEETRCDDAACAGRLIAAWLVGGRVVYLRREGWGDSVTAIYAWRPGNPPQRLFASEDALIGCDVAAGVLLCGREASLQPRRLWSLDLATRQEHVVFDPNPGFGRFSLPHVQRLHWNGSHGSEGYGDLVVPRTAPGSAGFPTVVVQYRTRGFLRGAVGDEYPILAFAARGFAVLSIENAKEYAALVDDPTVRDASQAVRLDTTDANERRLQLANLEQAVAEARSSAPFDTGRVGITGMSDAASSAVFALVNTKLFAVASIGSPAVDQDLLALGGPAAQADFHGSGYPLAAGEAEAFYRPIALAPNAREIATPILLQYPEDEYLGGLHAVAALEDAHAPVDLYVYPGEPHMKWQAAHRLALYRRNLAWFDFWLRNRDETSEASEAELGRWRAMRAQLCGTVALPGAPIQLCSQASTSTSSVTRK